MRRTLMVGDGLEDIRAGLRTALEGADLVVTSGGLGPTHDDRTVEAMARLPASTSMLDEDVLARIAEWTDAVAARNALDATVSRRQPQAGAYPARPPRCWESPARRRL